MLVCWMMLSDMLSLAPSLASSRWVSLSCLDGALMGRQALTVLLVAMVVVENARRAEHVVMGRKVERWAAGGTCTAVAYPEGLLDTCTAVNLAIQVVACILRPFRVVLRGRKAFVVILRTPTHPVMVRLY